LTNTNESVTVTKAKNFRELNTPLVLWNMDRCGMSRLDICDTVICMYVVKCELQEKQVLDAEISFFENTHCRVFH
jgi:hypothetical protein